MRLIIIYILTIKYRKLNNMYIYFYFVFILFHSITFAKLIQCITVHLVYLICHKDYSSGSILRSYILFIRCLQVEKHIKDTAQAQQQRELQQQTQKGAELQ